ncbi:hypothetical protein ACVWW2_003976 [Bradyrhizobium sp. LM4.3]
MTTNTREPRVHPVPILSLRPTQMTVGMREVKEKRKRWREHDKKKQADLLGRHMIPVVHGPDERYYVIDHHHLGRALHDEGVKEVLVTIVGDLRMVEREAFWGVMDNKRWVYPYDAKGERRPFRDLPKSIVDLKDDPFRSLAGELRRNGRLRQGHHAVLRIPVGRLSAPKTVAQGGGCRLRQVAREGDVLSQEQGCDLSARLVRTGGG